MAGTHLIYDLDPETSLARYLARSGFDTWLVDLRGRQRSWPDSGDHPDLQWCFDDFVDHDLPAAVDYVCEITGRDRVLYLGLEMSGQALYAAAIEGKASRIRAAVTFGAPALTPPTALVPGVTSAPRGRRRGRIPFRDGARWAGPLLAYARADVLESSFRRCNTAPAVIARYFRNGIPNEAVDLVEQFRFWVEHGTMQRRAPAEPWSERLRDVRLPILVVAAERDLQRPADAVEWTYHALGSREKRFVRAGKRHGFRVDYGHDDLLAGLASPSEIFPLVRDFLEEQCHGPT